MAAEEEIYRVDAGCVRIEYLVMGPIENNVYFISDGTSTIVVDPSCESERILAALGGRKVDAIVITHWHWDHVGAAALLRKATGAPVIASAYDAPHITGERPSTNAARRVMPCPVDRTVWQDDTVEVGSMPWRVIGTPGHTEGGICLYLDKRHGTNPAGAPVLIAGDTLFYGSIGRTDFEGGSLDDMRASLKRLAELPDETLVLPGHGMLTTIGDERVRTFARFA